MLFYCHIFAVVLQPKVIVAAKFAKLFFCGMIAVSIRHPQQIKAKIIQRLIIHCLRVTPPGKRLNIFPAEQAFLDKQVRINPIWIPGKSGKTLIGAVPVAGWSHRQNLPVALPCAL